MSDRKQSPCQFCTERFVGCHSTCENYISFRQSRDDYKNKVREQKNIRFGAAKEAICFSHTSLKGKSHKK